MVNADATASLPQPDGGGIGMAMRKISDDVAVRLYHLDPHSGAVTTLLYGTLADALVEAARQAEDLQPGLFLQTSTDVVAYLDFLEG